MAKNGGVTIKIKGDDSHFKKTLTGLGKVAQASFKTFQGGVTVTAALASAWSAAGVASVRYNAQLEQLQTSFETMTGSASKAADIMARIKDLGAATPFEVGELAEVTQLLMQYGLNAEKALDSTTMLGDISQGNADKLNRIAMAYGQMSSAGKVQLQDVKQMIEAGFNPLLEISERTGESMDSLYSRISKGTISVNEITESMQAATSEGGKFFQSMEKQSRTVNGQLSTIQDNVKNLGGTVFAGATEQLRNQILPETNKILSQLQTSYELSGPEGLVREFSRQLPRVVSAATNGAVQVMSSISKRLPTLIKSLLNSVPSIVRSAATFAPRLAETLYDTGSEAILQLVDMMPQWGPPLLEGAAKLGLEVGKGLFKMMAATLAGLADLVTEDAEDVWAGLYDREKVAELSAKVSGAVDIEEAKKAIETAYSELNEALNTELLSSGEVQQITELIGTDYDTIYAKLKSFGLSDEDAGALASKVTEASAAVIAEIEKLDISVDAGTVARWIVQAKGSRLSLKSALKRSGLTPEEQDEVVQVFTDMTDNINGKLPDVIGEIYDTLTDGKAENDNKESLKTLLDEAFKADIDEVDSWLEENIGELDTESSTYAADVAALTKEAAAYKGEITTLQAEMVALVESLAGQPTEIVEERMGEFAAIEARLAEINAYISETTTKAQNAYAQAYQRVRAGATTEDQDIVDALSYAYTSYKVNQQEIEDAAKAAKAEADAAWENGLKTEEDRKNHLDTLETITKNREADLKALEGEYRNQLTELMQGLGEAFAVTEPETMNQIEAIAEKLNISKELNAALESMQTEDDAIAKTAKQRLADMIGQITGDDLSLSEVSYGKAESFITDFENSVKEDLKNLEFDEGKNPVATAFETMFQSDAFADIQIDTDTVSEKISAIMNGVGQDASAGIGEGAAAYSFSGYTDTVAGNFETDASTSFGRNSPARKMYPVGADVAAGIGAGAAEYDFGEYADTVANNAETAIKSRLQNAGTNAGKNFSSGLAAGIRSGRSGVISAAVSVAQAAISAAKSALKINSPSKVTAELGRFYSEGLAIGISERASEAIRAAQRLADGISGPLNLKPMMQVSMPTLTADVISAIDNSNGRDISLYVNGKELGRVTANDNRLAQNRYNRSLALGVGKK